MTAVENSLDQVVENAIAGVMESEKEQNAVNFEDLKHNLPLCRMPEPEELQPVATFVAKAVLEQQEGKQSVAYDALVNSFKHRGEPVMLHRTLLACRTSGQTLTLVTKADGKQSHLLHQILRLNPAHVQIRNVEDDLMEFDILDALIHLLVAIVSANSVFLVPVLTRLWKLLTHSDEYAVKCHAAIRVTVQICPKAKSEIWPIIAANAPFGRSALPETLQRFYRQALVVLDYIPSLEKDLIEFMMEKCLEMDVEIKIRDGGEAIIEENADNVNLDAMFSMDDVAPSKPKPPLTRDMSVDDMADKLDSLMLLLFEHMGKESSNCRNTYQTVASVFESLILSTHKSKFVQFIIIYLCGRHKERLTPPDGADDEDDDLYRDFSGKLIQILVDPYCVTTRRQTGACYLASFVSRARYVCAETVCESVCALLRFADAYMASVKHARAAGAREQCHTHALFYTVSQAAFYIMCFRGHEAMVHYQRSIDPSSELYAERELVNIGPERWNRLCGHSLDPLRYCLSSVRSEFLHMSQLYSLLDVPQLERHMSSSATRVQRKNTIRKIMTAATLEMERKSGGVGGMGQGENPLDSFFPFDPYLLPLSHKYVEPYYRHWGANEDEVDSEEASDVMDEDLSAAVDDSASEDDDSSVGSQSSRSSEEDEDRHMAISIPRDSNLTSRSQSMTAFVSDDAAVQREVLCNAWENELKRARAPSIENGSW